MPDRERSDETRLDRALGTVLRDMVSGEGSEHMRGRVMAEISSASRRPGFPYRLAWATGLAAAIAAGVFLLARHGREAGVPRHVVGSTPPAPTTMPTGPQEPSTPRVTTTAKVRGTRTGEPPESAPLVPLPVPAPVDTAPLGIEELAYRRAVISGLELTRLDIEPLEPS